MNEDVITREEIDVWYKIHNIVYEKAELYCDFFISLIELIDSTYLGYDVLNNESDILGHFSWCFNKVLSNFEQENIFFNKKGEHFENLWNFFYDSFYTTNVQDRITRLSVYFTDLFNFTYNKTQHELDMMLQFYKMMDKNLKI